MSRDFLMQSEQLKQLINRNGVKFETYIKENR